jgi:hypothetical protein
MVTTPISDLATLLATLRPALDATAWAWCVLPDGVAPADALALACACVREDEGTTVVVPEAAAAARGWPVAFRSARVTLSVHSDLAAVGLTAAVAGALAESGIACNVIAGVHHDHLFVPFESAEATMATLHALSLR